MQKPREKSIELSLPNVLAEAIAEASKRRFITRAAYCRQAIAEQIHKDGVELHKEPVAA